MLADEFPVVVMASQQLGLPLTKNDDLLSDRLKNILKVSANFNRLFIHL